MIYLDISATTQPTGGVVAAIERALTDAWFNPSSMYAQAMAPEKEMNLCRDRIRKALKTPDARVIFTSGGTEANNLALNGTIGVTRPVRRVAVSAVEHPSVLETARLLEKQDCEVIEIPVNSRGELDYSCLEAELEKGLSLVSVMQVNNETGALTDIRRLSETVKELCPECRLHVDGVQGFLREDIDFRLIDMYTLSSHKIHGPKGVGALVVKKGLRLAAEHTGGGQEDALRSGTENTPGIIGLSEAIDEMLAIPDRREKMLNNKLRLSNGLKVAIPEAIINGPEPQNGACHVLNVSFPGVRGETMLHALEEKGILVSTGSACSAKKQKASKVLTAMGIPVKIAECAIRFSLNPFITADEIDTAINAVKENYDLLKRFQRR